MRALFGICAAIVALGFVSIACEDPETCPGVSPGDAGAALSPQWTSPHSSPPLSCAYFDPCGEIVCMSDNNGGWKCLRNEDWNNCDDAGGS